MWDDRFNYIQKNLSSYFTVLFFTPASVILNPVNTFATLIIYPVLFVLLAVVVVIFKAASELGVGGWINKLSEKYGGGYSFINWVRGFTSVVAKRADEAVDSSIRACLISIVLRSLTPRDQFLLEVSWIPGMG